jgi:hypothetical protein
VIQVYNPTYERGMGRKMEVQADWRRKHEPLSEK